MPNPPPASVTENEFERDNPLLCDVMENNIRTLLRLRQEGLDHRSTQDRVSDLITDFSGSMAFVYLHIVWFGLWVTLNTGRFGIKPFDPFPYGLLTMIVSLEAIFLSTFVLVSQNRTAEESARQAELAVQIGLITEHEVTRVLQMLDAIQDRLGIENDEDSELAQLEQETRPEDVLEEIARVRRMYRSNGSRIVRVRHKKQAKSERTISAGGDSG